MLCWHGQFMPAPSWHETVQDGRACKLWKAALKNSDAEACKVCKKGAEGIESKAAVSVKSESTVGAEQKAYLPHRTKNTATQYMQAEGQSEKNPSLLFLNPMHLLRWLDGLDGSGTGTWKWNRLLLQWLCTWRACGARIERPWFSRSLGTGSLGQDQRDRIKWDKIGWSDRLGMQGWVMEWLEWWVEFPGPFSVLNLLNLPVEFVWIRFSTSFLSSGSSSLPAFACFR